jgi:hypothetical protein
MREMDMGGRFTYKSIASLELVLFMFKDTTDFIFAHAIQIPSDRECEKGLARAIHIPK